MVIGYLYQQPIPLIEKGYFGYKKKQNIVTVCTTRIQLPGKSPVMF